MSSATAHRIIDGFQQVWTPGAEHGIRQKNERLYRHGASLAQQKAKCNHLAAGRDDCTRVVSVRTVRLPRSGGNPGQNCAGRGRQTGRLSAGSRVLSRACRSQTLDLGSQLLISSEVFSTMPALCWVMVSLFATALETSLMPIDCSEAAVAMPPTMRLRSPTLAMMLLTRCQSG